MECQINRICPHKFDLERTQYYRFKACTEILPVSEVGTIYSDRFHPIKPANATKDQSDGMIRMLKDRRKIVHDIYSRVEIINDRFERNAFYVTSETTAKNRSVLDDFFKNLKEKQNVEIPKIGTTWSGIKS